MTRRVLLAALLVFALIPSFFAAFDDPAPKLGHARIADAVPPVNAWSATPPPPTTAPAVHAASSGKAVRAVLVTSEGSVNGYPCGGSLPPCSVLACESGGNPTAENPTSTASGLWQVLISTWGGFGGYAEAYLAPPEVQNEHARILWAGGKGASHWASCL